MTSLRALIGFGLLIVVSSAAGLYVFQSIQTQYSASQVSQNPLGFDRVLRYQGQSVSLSDWMSVARAYPTLSTAERIRLICLTLESGNYRWLLTPSRKAQNRWLAAIKNYRPTQAALVRNDPLLARITSDER